MLLFMTKKQKETMAEIRNQSSLKNTGGSFFLDSEVVKENLRSHASVEDQRFMRVLIKKNQKEENRNRSWMPSFMKRGESSSSKESDTPSLNDMYVSGECPFF